MAKQRASLPLPRVSSSSASSTTSSSSAASCIAVAGPHSASALLPLLATPPTSVSEGDSVGAPADKEAVEAPEASELTRRSSRRKSGPASYSLRLPSGHRRTEALEKVKEDAGRSFSGETLVDDASGSTSNTSQRRLLDEGVKALDMDWRMDELPGDNPSDLPPRPKRGHRSSIDLLVEKTGRAVGRVKSVLGKRERDDDSSSSGRRQSRRLADRHEKPVNVQDGTEDDDIKTERIEKPSKLARLSSNFSLNVSSVFSSSAKPSEQASTKPVKQYQSQGLFAGQTVDGPDSQSQDPKPKRRSVIRQRPLSAYFAADSKQDKRSSTISLPMFSYLERDRPFTIPYDVFAPVRHQRGEEKPKDWGRVSKNRLYGDAKELWKKPRFERSLCVCQPPPPGSSEPGCGDGCHNRAMDYECDENNCRLGDLCTNRDFAELAARVERATKSDKKSAHHLYNAGVEVVKTQDRGFGVRACRSFDPGQIITEYTGEIITADEASRRIEEDYRDKADYYQMEFDQCMILDATRGSIARFVNHSCEPNCRMIKRFVAGHPRMALFAGDHGIMTGEELTYDYNFDPYSVKNVQECRCGAANCRGVLGPRPKDANKPTTKKEKEGMAAGMKRKVGELIGSNPPVELDKTLFKKRKVPQMTKGWVYVDDEMEKLRIEEAAKDKEIARLQREGVLSTDMEVKKTTRTTTVTKDKSGAKRFVQRVTTKMTGHKPKDTPEAAVKKPGMLGRLSGSLKYKTKEVPRPSVSVSARKARPGRHSMEEAASRRSPTKVRPVSMAGASMGRTLRMVQADE